jgi:hypothetical protein
MQQPSPPKRRCRSIVHFVSFGERVDKERIRVCPTIIGKCMITGGKATVIMGKGMTATRGKRQGIPRTANE